MRSTMFLLVATIAAGGISGCIPVRHPHDEGWLGSNSREVKIQVKRVGSHTQDGTTWFTFVPEDAPDVMYSGKASGTECFGFRDRNRLDNFIEIDLDNAILPMIRDGDVVRLRLVDTKIVRARRVTEEKSP